MTGEIYLTEGNEHNHFTVWFAEGSVHNYWGLLFDGRK